MYSEKVTDWLLSGSEEAEEVAEILSNFENRIWEAGRDFDRINAQAGSSSYPKLKTIRKVKIFAFHAANKVRGFV